MSIVDSNDIQDLGLLDSLQVHFENNEATTDYLNSMFINASSIVFESSRYITYHNVLMSIYAIWEKVNQGALEKMKQSKKLTDLSKFTKRLFNCHTLQTVRSKIAKRKSKQPASDIPLESSEPLAKISRKRERQFDIFKGPKMIAKCQNQPGVIVDEVSRQSTERTSPAWERCSYMTLVILNLNDEGIDFEEETRYNMLLQASIAHTFDQFLDRILDCGLDVICSISPLRLCSTCPVPPSDPPEVNRRLRFGRCWRMRNSKFKVLGFLLDTPGNFSCLQWCPDTGYLHNDSFTVTMYIDEHEPEFLPVFELFRKGESTVKSFIEQLGTVGVTCVASLYF